MKHIPRAWLVCAGCALLLFCTIGLVSSIFSVYQPYLISDSGLTNTQASALVTIRNLFGLAAMLTVGFYYRKLSLRVGTVLALTAAVVAYLLFGLAPGFFVDCAASAVSGLAYGFGGMVPVSLLIGRWFHQRQALALGLCSAGTGAAAIVMPPLLTALIEHTSLHTAFLLEAGTMALLAAAVAALVRSSPKDSGLTPLGAQNAEITSPAASDSHTSLTHVEAMEMLFAIALIGAIANPGSSYLSMLYRTNGFSSGTVALLLSTLGIALTAGKCVYGQAVDHMGAARSGRLFFVVLFLGESLNCLAGSRSVLLAVAAMLLQGGGLPLGTVGLTVFARDLSSSAQYAATVRHFQVAYMTGGLLFSSVPGVLADVTGSYLPTFRLLTLFALTSAALVLEVYHQRSREMLLRLRTAPPHCA